MTAESGSGAKVVYRALSRQAFELDLGDVILEGRLDILPHVEERGLLFLQFRKGKLVVTPGAFVGLIPLTPKISFDVRPKLPVSNLARVVDVARRSLNSIPGADRLYLANEHAEYSVLEFLGSNLVDALNPITANGLHKDYIRRSDATSHPRGRIELAETMRGWSRGQFHKVQAQRFEQSSDVPVNRLLKTALEFVLRRLRPHSPECKQLMIRANLAFVNIPQLIRSFTSSDYLAARKVLRTRSLPIGRSYYYRAIEVALLILSNQGIALQENGADVLLGSFIINFDDLFEEYLRRVLQMRAPDLLTVQDGNIEGKRNLFQDRNDQTAQPDVVFVWQPTARSVIGEIKYKERPSREDINQAITYALCYGADRVILIHQSRKEGQGGLRHHGTMRGIRLETYAFDLGAADLAAEEAAFASAMFDLVVPRQNEAIAAA